QVEWEAQTKKAVGGADDAQVRRADLEDLGLGAEQAEPSRREERGGEANRLRDTRRQRRAGPGDAARALSLPGTDVRADHRDERRAEAEHERNLEILEAHAQSVPRQREGAERSDQRREQDDREVRLDVVDEARRAHAQDVPEQAALETDRLPRGAGEASTRDAG